MITKLKLRHFKSHELTEVEFGPGTNIIVGTLGSGKTSLVEAICFGLFGTTPGLKDHRIKLSELVMSRPAKYNDASVELTIEADNETYVIERSIRDGAGNAFLRLGTKLVDTGSERVTESVEKIVGADYELFSRAIYSEQNNLDYLLTLGRGERKKQVDQLLGIDRLESARANCNVLANKLKSKREEARNYLEGIDFEALKKQHAESQAALNDAAIEASRLTAELDAANVEIARIARETEKLEANERAANALATRIASLNALVDSQKEQMQGLGSEVQQTIGSKKKELVNKEAQDAKAKLEALKSARFASQQLQSQKENMSGQIQYVNLTLEGLAAVIEPDEAQAVLKAATAKAASVQKEAELAGQKLAEWMARIKENQTQMQNAQQAVLQLAKSEAAAVNAAKELERIGTRGSQEEINALVEKIASSQAHAAQAASAMAALQEAGAQCPTCMQPIEAHAKTELMAHYSEATRTEHLQLQKVEGELQNSRQFAQSRQKLEQEHATSRQMIELLAAQTKPVAQLENERQAMEAIPAKQDMERARENLTKASEELTNARTLLQNALEKQGLEKKQKELSLRIKELEVAIASAGTASDSDVDAAQKHVLMLEKALEFFKSEEKIEALRKERRDAEQALADVGFDAAALSKARERKLELATQAGQCATRVENVRKKGDELKASMAKQAEAIARAQSRSDEIAKLDARVTGVMKFQSALLETQVSLRAQLVEGINEVIDGLWANVYPYGDYVSARLFAGDDDYDLQLKTNDGQWIASENVSGGERSCAVLCLRVSFSVILAPKLSWLILDEPTHNLDSRAVQLLATALREQIPQLVSQTFIITHDEALKEAASAKIYLVERDKQAGDRSTVETLEMQL